MAYTVTDWPVISQSPRDILSLAPTPHLGVDFEWDVHTSEPTILGVSDGQRSVSVPYDDGASALVELLRQHPQTSLVGHNVIDADLPIVESLLGRSWPVTQSLDTILLWWLTNMHLCKSTGKGDDAESDRRGRGFLNLWAMCSVNTSLPNWKRCRGPMCYGPCPEHNIFGYNGTDALGPVLALPSMMHQMDLFGLWGLYAMHAELLVEFRRMRQEGIRVDLPYVEQLRRDFLAEKLQYWNPETEAGLLPFNPRSPKQLKEFFKGITLGDAQESTIRSTLAKLPAGHALAEPLEMLLTYKELGNGPDRWLAPREWDQKKREWSGFVWDDGFVRPHFGPYTSSGRNQCAGPNLQNVEKRRIDRKTGEKVGVRMRRAFIPRDGHYFLRADYKNAENLNFLYMANPKGYSAILAKVRSGVDFHNWMAENMGIHKEDEFAIRLGSPRDASKSVTHASDYGEGLQLKEAAELRTPRLRKEVSLGARLVFPDWKFEGKIVTFTGANLAERAWGKKSFENRARALAATERYFSAHPEIRDLQKQITRQIEREKMVRPPHGYVLRSFGYLEDRVKTGLAVWGSQPVAHLIKQAQLNVAAHPKLRAVVLSVHDELVVEVEKGVPVREADAALRECMEFETKEMPGLVIPTDRSWGYSWADKRKVE